MSLKEISQRVDSNAQVILNKNGINKQMSFGAFDREQKEAMPRSAYATLQSELLAGKTVEVQLVDSMCKRGTVRLAL